MQIQTVCDFLEQLAPSRLAEEWDNVGLLVGDPERDVRRVMSCLTITPSVASEAVSRQADLIVTHHPLPFRATKRITTGDTPGRLLWELIGAGISIYSPHTAWDSAAAGINQQFAEGLGLQSVEPLKPWEGDPDGLGSGRMGRFTKSLSLDGFAEQVKHFLKLDGLHVVGTPDHTIRRVAIACGAAGTFLQAAHEAGCDALVTGETNFHTCLEAEALDVALILPGHFASERFALETLAWKLAEQFPKLEVWASRHEVDPLRWT